MTIVGNADQARQLAARIVSPTRDRVVVVITHQSKARAPHFDRALIAGRCAHEADIWEVPSGEIGYALSNNLVDGHSVYGGAARVYPPGFTADADPREAPLFLAYSSAEALEVTDRLVAAVRQAARNPLYPSRFAPAGGGSSIGDLLSPKVAAALANTDFSETPNVRPAKAAAKHRAPVAVEPEGPPAERRGALQGALAANDRLKAQLAAEKAAGAKRVAAAGQAHGVELRETRIENAELMRKVAELSEKVKASGAAARAARSSATTDTADGWSPGAFTDPTDAVRHAILVAWVDRVPAGEKNDYPLPEYIVGPGFAATIDDLDTGQRAKALRCCVDVLTGRARDVAAREVHVLRGGSGGADAAWTRDDGAVAFRAYVEQNSPSARRLHYWKLPDGTIELSRVVLHDDVNP